MSRQTAERRLTAQDLWELEASGQHFELDEGRLLEMTPSGPRHGWAVAQLTIHLGSFVNAHNLGMIFGAETGFCLSDDCVRAPDLAFLKSDRVSAETLPEQGYFQGAPDLAVEVLSPEDFSHPGAVQRKIAQYLESGTQLVWVVDPRGPKVVVYRADGSVDVLGRDGTLSGEDLIPGFAGSISEIFGKLPTVPQPAPPKSSRSGPGKKRS